MKAANDEARYEHEKEYQAKIKVPTDKLAAIRKAITEGDAEFLLPEDKQRKAEVEKKKAEKETKDREEKARIQAELKALEIARLAEEDARIKAAEETRK
jgi:hypothetical protein